MILFSVFTFITDAYLLRIFPRFLLHSWWIGARFSRRARLFILVWLWYRLDGLYIDISFFRYHDRRLSPFRKKEIVDVWYHLFGWSFVGGVQGVFGRLGDKMSRGRGSAVGTRANDWAPRSPRPPRSSSSSSSLSLWSFLYSSVEGAHAGITQWSYVF